MSTSSALYLFPSSLFQFLLGIIVLLVVLAVIYSFFKRYD